MTIHADSSPATSRLARLAVLAALPWAAAAPLLAQADGAPITCGAYRTLHSTVLGEDRTLLVGLPADYEKSGRTYPVLYRLDGDSVTFLHTLSATAYLVDMREQKSDYIVIAIQNTNRRRDMDPEGGADNFLRFIKSELVPFVEKGYRANGSRILAGQSFSALFALYSLLKEPDLFEAYLLGSFALYKPELTPLFEDALKKSPLAAAGHTAIFSANGKLDTYDPDGSRTKRGAQFLASLSRNAPAVAIKTVVYDDEGHVPFGFVYDGLKWLDSRERAAARERTSCLLQGGQSASFLGWPSRTRFVTLAR